MIKSLLIANRGEIACRIIRTARDMGIRTVAVYSDADAKALHVREADEAVHIGPSAATESYLVADKILAAAKETGAEAIHPGYGFLSENADFAQDVIDAGLIWVGPKPDSIRAMGLKDAAKTLMDNAGVPTTPGYIGDNQDADYLAEQAGKIGYPVLIKAVAGGGGKGMRKVDAAADFADALVSCQREAAASFGNDIVLIEKWIESPRHIEVQVFGDSHGNVVHLFERDCSLQRRHQKVIEEAPAPGIDEATREAVCAAAVRAAQAVDYEGAGTIEFIADGSEGLRADRIWFMEMNTRLQVEHPVTEEITGVDLVEWQLLVASGAPIPVQQDELSIDGWAIEARLYAEDPVNGFLPSTGPLDRLFLDADRIETGVEEGDEVSPHYDPMIAKLIVHDETREEAIAVLAECCEATEVWPVKTNAGFLAQLLHQPEFQSGDMTTGFIGGLDEAITAKPELDGGTKAAVAQSLAANYADLASQQSGLLNFRLNSPHKDGFTVRVDGGPTTIPMDGSEMAGLMPLASNEFILFDRGFAYSISRRATGAGEGAASDGAILSPMPGKIIAVNVAAGDAVTKGQKLLTLEAMKMEHSLVAPFDGTVAELNAELDGQVSEGTLLVEIGLAEIDAGEDSE
ncbi:acetyl/propionyl/methylcrotonyl-CoA carboxylase subunit alpha [Sphingorhabdus sp. Alg239-R122]|uniref:acetyl-CoA carboxylase biotin carboxylase subunit n=1 Tax=Sphingorhabdus sp. Alg239-R122 TaxID=2305989 RepID=UPI0013DD2D58|nr:acetyl/propionyl/methylcrotonyl-CoA carboxylase subunit alpha [Sphingorhabdus sp. Alg239-R122]